VRSISVCLAIVLFLHAKPSKEPLPYRSFAGDFERLSDETQHLPMPERVRTLQATFAKLCPGLYTDADQTKLKAQIERALADFPELRASYDEIQSKFPQALADTGSKFREAFPHFSLPMPIYLFHSLGTRDGGTDLIAGHKVMLFGADEMAQFHNDDSLQPFIIHELFHLEHSRHFEDCFNWTAFHHCRRGVVQPEKTSHGRLDSPALTRFVLVLQHQQRGFGQAQEYPGQYTDQRQPQRGMHPKRRLEGELHP